MRGVAIFGGILSLAGLLLLVYLDWRIAMGVWLVAWGEACISTATKRFAK